MTVHVPGLVWAAAFFAAALIVRMLPDRPPPLQITDKYLHVPSTFPTALSGNGLRHTGPDRGMSPAMRPYGMSDVGPRKPMSMRAISNRLALWGAIWLALAFLTAT